MGRIRTDFQWQNIKLNDVRTFSYTVSGPFLISPLQIGLRAVLLCEIGPQNMRGLSRDNLNNPTPLCPSECFGRTSHRGVYFAESTQILLAIYIFELSLLRYGLSAVQYRAQKHRTIIISANLD